MQLDRLLAVVDAFPDAAIAVLGDFFLDDYIILDPALSEISLETGLEAYQVVATRPSPGAAGTVACNLAALKVGRVIALGAVGDDGHGYELRQGLAARGIEHECLLVSGTLTTPTYTKPMLLDISAPGGERELNRMDVKWRSPTPAAVGARILSRLDALLPDLDAVIIADQVQERNHGVVTDAVREGLAARARENPSVHFIADSRAHIGLFRDVLVKPNVSEAACALGMAADDHCLVAELAQALSCRTGCPTFITMGAEGIMVWDGQATHVATLSVEGEIDIVGAGDSTLAGICAALCSGASFAEAALIGNLVASITIRQLGTTGTASPPELRDALRLWSAGAPD